jgi:hypothetical protein
VSLGCVILQSGLHHHHHHHSHQYLWYFDFSQQYYWRFRSFGILCRLLGVIVLNRLKDILPLFPGSGSPRRNMYFFLDWGWLCHSSSNSGEL